MKKIIFYELNEVPKKIFDYYSDIRIFNSFFHLKRFGRKYLTNIETKIQDSDLSPWITWPTVHRGINPEIHGIKILGQSLSYINKHFPPIWEILAKNNISVGLVGSLHSYSSLDKTQDSYKFFLPDTFALGPETIPEYLTSFQDFNLSQVKINGRYPTSKIMFNNFFEIIKNYIKLGFNEKTAYKILKQLTLEVFNKNKVVRRRSLQANLTFDIFFYHLLKKKTDVNFFFTNHVASAMHRYWPSIFPKDYKKMSFDKEWIQTWKQEIPYAIREADIQLNKLINFVDRNHEYKLCVVSSMGQAAVDSTQLEKTQLIIRDVSKLMAFIGISITEYVQNISMMPQISVKLINKRAIHQMKINIPKFKICNKKIEMNLNEETGDCELDIHVANQTDLSITYDGVQITKEKVGFENMQIVDNAGSSAYHINQGIYIEYENKFKYEKQDSNWHNISLASIFDNTLSNFKILNK